MQVYTTDRNIRVFAASIAYLAKCGKEISFEGTKDSVSVFAKSFGAFEGADMPLRRVSTLAR
jgi:hypothetical protein